MISEKIQQAIDLVNQYPEYWRSKEDEGASQETIQQTEKLLNKKFPKEFKDYPHYFGNLRFDGAEFKGISNNNLEGVSDFNIVYNSLEMYKLGDVPDYLISVYWLGNGEEYYLNYHQLNEEGEPKITVYFPGSEDYFPMKFCMIVMGIFYWILFNFLLLT